MKNVVNSLKSKVSKLCWINLREEPLIYLNGVPYVLRDQFLTLRNTKSYSGIDSNRLEGLEMKLKEDLIAELDSYYGRILLHSETVDGVIEPIWEDISCDAVLTIREAMASLSVNEGMLLPHSEPNDQFSKVNVKYHRSPHTSEVAPK